MGWPLDQLLAAARGAPWPAVAPSPSYRSTWLAVSRYTSENAAWAELTVQGLIPAGFLRWERCYYRRRARLAEVGGVQWRPQPGDLRLALCTHLRVPGSWCSHRPIAPLDAAWAVSHAAAVERAEELAREAARRLREIGQPTAALALRDEHDNAEPEYAIWTTFAPSKPERDDLPMARFLAWALRVALPGPVPASLKEALPNGHYSEWTPLQVAAAGHLLWREAAQSGALLGPRPDDAGERVHFHPHAGLRPVAALKDPFEPLLQLRDLGVSLRAVSPDAVVLRAVVPRP